MDGWMGWMDGWDISQTTTTTRAPLAVLTTKFPNLVWPFSLRAETNDHIQGFKAGPYQNHNFAWGHEMDMGLL